MILVGEHERYISADHIQHIYIRPLADPPRYEVIVQMFGASVIFGRREGDTMTMQMALELRRRIVKAIVDYKSSDTPEIQHVDLPTYKEVHPKEDAENS